MKKSILVLGTAMFLFMGSITLTSCGNSNDKSSKQEQTEEVYACPMHPNITGKKGDTCSVCGMELTSTKTAKEHQGHSH
ncbi:MAG: hypothetical protein J7K39_09865 [Bacteroidales bacterium]|nr:hypothetical protein [Bacteroidales bacterium]